MNDLCPSLCPQCKRALRLLIDPSKPQVDRPKLRESLPDKAPVSIGDLLDLIIQIILAMLEGKNKPDPDPPMPPPKK